MKWQIITQAVGAGFFESTVALEVPGFGCLIRSTLWIGKDFSGALAQEAHHDRVQTMIFVPGVRIQGGTLVPIGGEK